MQFEHYDSLEIRNPQARERDLIQRLPDVVARAMTAPGWAAQLSNVDPASVTSRAALAKLPLLRKSGSRDAAETEPAFGGFNTRTPVNAMRRLQDVARAHI